MFESARLKLTAWYLVIIMLVAVLFSSVIYAVITQEYGRFERVQKLRQEREGQGRHVVAVSLLDPQVIPEARARLQAILLVVNLGILGIAGFAGYFLAGRTLKPIKEMLDEQNRFITDISHELRTPLTALKSEIEVNLRDESLTLKGARKVFTSNLEEVSNLQLLSDSLIKLTQYQKSNGNIVFVEVALRQATEEAQKKVAILAKHKQITVVNQIEDCNLEADRQSLLELFVILLDNAIKYSANGTTVTLTSKKKEGFVFITLEDQGIGINTTDIPHLFDRFYRADKSRTKTAVSGYGLGLSIAWQIVQKHNGTIAARSEIGKGTTFSVQLPLKHS